MKKVLLIFTYLALSQNLFPQGLFPLNKGNLWQYVEPYLDSPMSATIIGDSLLPNGKQYSFFVGNVFPSPFLRQSGSMVFAYNIYDSTEWIMFDYSKRRNDTVSIHTRFGQQIVTILTDTGRIASSNLRWWNFVDYMVNANSSYYVETWTVLDSIGVIEILIGLGYEWYLSGAKINGVVRWGVITSATNEDEIGPHNLLLFQNYPNPFNPTTSIKFILPEADHVILKIFNILGKQVAVLLNEFTSSGEHTLKWNATSFPNGIYFYNLQTRKYSKTKKLLLLK
jgi:hypothetical protein